MAAPFDPLLYAYTPSVTPSSGVSLASALVDACPRNAPAGVKKAASYLDIISEQVRAELSVRSRQLGIFQDEDTRGLDNEADHCWRALRLALQSKAMLRLDLYPQAKLAAAIEAALFPPGPEPLKADYFSQSSGLSASLRRVDEDPKLEKDINALVGPEFLAAIRDVQPRYEAMVKERLRRDVASGQDLTERVRAIQSAIVSYVSKVVASVEQDEPPTIELARKALLPLANHREATLAAQRAALAA